MAEQSSLRRDIGSAYLASGAKILSWVVVSAMVYRVGGAAEFGLLSLIRGTIGILAYVSFGVGPAMIKLLAGTLPETTETAPEPTEGGVLSYHHPEIPSRLNRLYSNALTFAFITAAIGIALLIPYALFFNRLHHNRGILDNRDATLSVFFLGAGLIARLASDVPGAVLQTTGRITKDNQLLLTAELLWIAFTALLVKVFYLCSPAIMAATVFFLSSAALFIARAWYAESITGKRLFALDRAILRPIIRYGGLITLAQLADYLYAPTDYILINRFLGTLEVAAYAPAIQIDAGLLVLVSGMAAVLFPRSAIAHSAGDIAAVRRYYIRGTLAGAGLLIVAALLVWLISPILFRLWLGNPMRATQAILPLVLIHTIIGGSSMVGRSILLATGKFAPFAISVLIAGVTNVVLSYIFVKYLHWGLRGIVLGTIIAVVARCLFWMPWYILRTLRQIPAAALEPASVPTI